ncbi:hypothetical protein [Jeotgalibacillus haloalkalitolerans]|uniref:DUF3221 domain-containing protein n=1 Tax=Jeotgalibacillus haloalkalitolerans TaxID=3104292 RepID=A0ABU5KJB1_9BACL|nr:hypothetical protein [Jeotgalibacillus sp. HH7-29]MDZ5711011.1 hypothetical protein [Jeotgalibacillus sp. HH7-29]
MKQRVFITLMISILLTGCSKKVVEEEVTMEQLMINEGIVYEEVLVTVPYDSEYGFAIYTTEEGIGNAQFSTVNGQWNYTGSTEFSSANTAESPIISFGMTHWEMNDGVESDRQPVAIIAGEITDEVSRIEIEFDEDVKEGKIVKGDERTIWYWAGGYSSLERVEVRAFDQASKVIDSR